MLKFLKNNFETTNNCIILTTPMVLFFISLQWYIETFRYNLNSLVNQIVFFITLWIWISGCFAGWFYMVKKTIQFSQKTFLSDIDRTHELKELLLCLFKGVGKYFVSFLTVVAFCFVLKILKIAAIITAFTFDIANVLNIISNIEFILFFILAYWAIFWIPEIIYNYVSPYKALINSVKMAIISFTKSAPIYTFICIVCFVLFNLLLKSIQYPILYFIILLLLYYFILYAIISVFKLYEENFIK